MYIKHVNIFMHIDITDASIINYLPDDDEFYNNIPNGGYGW